jgi:hypothetical protein
VERFCYLHHKDPEGLKKNTPPKRGASHVVGRRSVQRFTHLMRARTYRSLTMDFGCLSSRAHVYGALAGWIARIRLFVEGHFLTVTKIFELNIDNRRAVEEQVVPATV